MTLRPASTTRIWFDEVGEGDAQANRLLRETLEHVRGPWKLEQMHFTHLSRSGVVAFWRKRADDALGNQRQGVTRTAQGARQLGNPISIPSHQPFACALSVTALEMGLHRWGPFGRMDDEATHRLRPQCRVLGFDRGSHTRDLSRRCARTVAGHEGLLGWPVVRS